MPPYIVTSKTQNRYQLPPQGPFVCNLGSEFAQGLVAWYPLGDGGPVTLWDYNPTQTKRHLTINGALGRKALEFGGFGYANTGATANWLSGTNPVSAVPLSASIWVVPASAAGVYNLINIGDTTGNNYFNLTTNNHTPSGSVDAGASTSGGEADATSAAALVAGRPTQVTGIWASTTSRAIYVNGGGKATNATSKTPSGIAQINVGAYRVGASSFSPLSGGVFDCRVWNVALTDAQVARLYDPFWRWDLYYQTGRISYDRFSPRTGGGTTFTGSYAGSVTAAGSLVKAVSKPLAGSSTPAGALAKAASKPLAGSVTGAGSLAKAAAKPLAGSSTATGAEANLLTRRLAAAGSSTAAGALAKAAAKPLAGSSTATGALAKRAGKPLAGSSTGTGSLAKAASKPMAGSSTAAGATAKAVSKAFAGSSTAAGSLTAIGVKLLALAGSVTGTGSLTRQAGKGEAGSVGGSGSLANTARSSLAGTLTAAGALAKAAAKALGGSATPTGGTAFSRVALLALAGAVGAVGALARFVGKVLAGSAAPAGDLSTSGGQVHQEVATIIPVTRRVAVAPVARSVSVVSVGRRVAVIPCPREDSP